MNQYIKYIVLGIIVACLLPGAGIWSIIGAGSVGVVTRLGAINRVANPGLVLKIPLIEYTNMMDTRTQKDQLDAQAASKDLQIVKSTIAVNYHLDGSKATSVFQNIGTDYQDKVVSPAIQDTFKAITASYTAEELITQREAVRNSSGKDLAEKLKLYNIIVDNFNIVNFDFSAEFNSSIEQKQVAQQNLEKAKLEAQTAITQAQGQADAQKALKDSGALTPEYLQFLALKTWNGVLPLYTGANIPFVNIK